jgi:hypothetical protein
MERIECPNCDGRGRVVGPKRDGLTTFHECQPCFGRGDLHPATYRFVLAVVERRVRIPRWATARRWAVDRVFTEPRRANAWLN